MDTPKKGPEPKKPSEMKLNPETKVAQDIFTRERGVNRDMPLTEFLVNVEKETRDQLRDERGKGPR